MSDYNFGCRLRVVSSRFQEEEPKNLIALLLRWEKNPGIVLHFVVRLVVAISLPLRLSIALIPGFVQFRTQSLNWNEYLIIQRHSKPYHSTELFFTNFRKSILKIWIEVLRTNVGTSRENLKRYTYAIQAILCYQDEGAVANHEICIHSFCNLIAF